MARLTQDRQVVLFVPALHLVDMGGGTTRTLSDLAPTRAEIDAASGDFLEALLYPRCRWPEDRPGWHGPHLYEWGSAWPDPWDDY